MKVSTRWSRRGSSGRRNWTIPLLITAAGLAASLPCSAQEPPTPAIIDDQALLTLTSVGGTLMLGYKWERVVLGVGLDLARLGTANKYNHAAGTGSNETTVTSFLVYPALQVALARSDDQRAELFGGLQVGVGSVATSREQELESPGPDPEPPPEAPSTLRLGFRLGLGVRYWAHPHVGISVMSGLGTDSWATSDENSESSVALTGMFGSFGVIGAF